MSKVQSKHRVLIVGGGFGGLWAARSLKKADVDITLIDKRNFHLFQPLLYQVATGGLSPADIASPLRGVLARQQNISVKLGEMTGIDFTNQQIRLQEEYLPYDSLIIATGSENYYHGNDHWRQVAPGLKTIEDAINIRNRIYTSFENAEKEADPELRKELMTFVIVGGGATGVELAGALGEIARITLRDNFHDINPADARIFVIESGDEILTGFSPKLRQAAHKTLEKLGVTILTNSLVKQISTNSVTIKENERTYLINTKTVIWAAGVKSTAVADMLVPDKNNLHHNGQIQVTDQLTLPGHDNVYVIGDLAYKLDTNGKPLPGTAPVAMSQGRYATRRITSLLNQKDVKEYVYHDKGKMAVIGRAAAVADIGPINFTGYPAWLLWLFVHIMYLVEFDNRLVVFVQWAWNFFTRNRGARLITYNTESNENR